jgi:predicted CXXCH cytochrome family protein
MAEYGIPVDQVEEYQRSVHRRLIHDQEDLSAPTCNDCHGNHGAAPPGVSWVGSVCGQCHAVIDEQFEQSLHAQVFPLLGNPGCATCHQNHAITEASDDMLGMQEGAVCVRCHSAGSSTGEKVAEMKSLISSLLTDYDTATALLRHAERAGIEVSQAQFELQDARNALVGARTTLHSFDVEALDTAVAKGLEVTARGKERGMAALGELRFRRAGLAVSVLIILVLIVGLVLKIRELEART